MKMILSLTLIFAEFSAFAKVSAETEKSINNIFSKYRKSPFIEMKLEKKVVSEIMGTEKNYDGDAIIGAKKFRFESESPEKALVVYDGKTLWNVQYPTKGAEGKTQAARVAINKKSRGQIFLLELLQESSVVKEFDLSNETKDGDFLKVTAKPKSAKMDVSSMDLKFNLKDKRLSEVEYADDLGNKTIFKLIKQKNLKKVNGEKFEFKPGKDVEVVDL